MKSYVIIPAAGCGKRMKTHIPKQFVPIHNKPILMHTINKFYLYDSSISIIVALPKDYIEFWGKLCKEYKFNIPHQIVVGGRERFFSVKNALSLIKEPGIVAIHDAVRPLVDIETIHSAFTTAEEKGCAIPVIPVKETLCYADEKKLKIADRTKYFIVQTPQCFRTEIILKAYKQKYKKSFTDDASVVEAMGTKIFLIQGNEKNIKITTPIDLSIAKQLLRKKS